MTRAVFAALADRMEVMTSVLQEQAGINPLTDREYVGYINAVKDILRADVEDFSKENE